MNGPGTVFRHFPGLDEGRRERFGRLGPLYAQWNERVNLVSRKDIGHLYERHILHSLGIAKVHSFSPGSRIIDVGTGGGLPLVPLAVLFPECSFHGIDGIGKKIAAVQGIIAELGLANCTAEQVRSTEHRGRYDVVVSRAVAPLPQLVRDTEHLLARGRGRMYCLKGGDLADELLPVRRRYRVHELSRFFPGEFFATKKVVEVEM